MGISVMNKFIMLIRVIGQFITGFCLYCVLYIEDCVGVSV